MNLEALFKRISLLFCFNLSYILSLAIFGFFEKNLLIILIYLNFLIVIFFLLKNFLINKIKLKTSPVDLAALALTLIFCLIAFFFHHELAKGRDEMVHLVSAVKLTETHSLAFKDDFAIMFSGFEQINDNIHTSQFLPAYIASIAFFYEFFKLPGVYLLNAFLFFLGLTALYFLGKNLKNSATGLAALSWFGTLYVTFWFSKRLNSELLFFTLFWITIWYFFDCLKHKKGLWYFVSYLPLSLLLLTRGEGLLYVFTYFIFSSYYIFKNHRELKKSFFKKRNFIFLCLPTLNLTLLFFYLAKYNSVYLISQIQNYQGSLKTLFVPLLFGVFIFFVLAFYLIFVASADLKTKLKANGQKYFLFILLFGFILYESLFLYFTKIQRLKWSFYRVQFSLEIFILYFLFIFVLFIFYGLYRKYFNRFHLILALICSPAFIFLVESNIAPDQPWFMRRYFAVLIPLLVLLAGYVFSKLNIYVEKKVLIFVSVVILNLTLALPVINFVENGGVEKNLNAFAKNFSKNDLILFEPGWDFQRWSYAWHFLYRLNVVPNLNFYPDKNFKEELKKLVQKYPNWSEKKEDLLAIKTFHDQKRLENLQPYLNQYHNVYLLTTSPFNYPFYDVLNLKFVDEFQINYQSLNQSTEILDLIKNSSDNLDLNTIRERQQNTPPREVKNIKNNLLILKVVDKNKTIINQEISSEEAVKYRAYLTTLLRE